MSKSSITNNSKSTSTGTMMGARGLAACTSVLVSLAAGPPVWGVDQVVAPAAPEVEGGADATSASVAPSEAAPLPAPNVPVESREAAAAPALKLDATRPEQTIASPPGDTPPAWLKSLSIGGGVILWYYRPVDLAGAKSNVDLFFANLLLDGRFGAFALHIEPRFRDSRLRDFFPGPVWAQEAYGSATLASNTVLKVGKAYSHFGLFWENSFYGNVQVYDGLKLDPDYGLSLEGAIKPDDAAGMHYWAQFFVIDGHTNVSLNGRDTISLPGGHRRNQTIVRVEPFYRVTDHVTVTGGLSGAFLQADLGATAGTKNVYRGAVDVSLVAGAFGLWAEYTRQNGQSVTDFPVAGTAATATAPAVAGRASSHNDYALAGTQYAFGPVTLRYNVSTGRYEDVSVSEWLHVPAVAYAVGDNFTVLGEYVDWRRYAPGGSSIVDHSVNVTLAGHF
jgi:hypothetical protein